MQTEIPETFWAWLAGFWEGEGSLSYDGKNGMRIGQKNPTALFLIKTILGGSVYASHNQGRAKITMHVWQICANPQVRTICQHILPYVVSRKNIVQDYLNSPIKNRYHRSV